MVPNSVFNKFGKQFGEVKKAGKKVITVMTMGMFKSKSSKERGGTLKRSKSTSDGSSSDRNPVHSSKLTGDAGADFEMQMELVFVCCCNVKSDMFASLTSNIYESGPPNLALGSNFNLLFYSLDKLKLKTNFCCC